VILPSAAPYVFTGVRIAATMALLLTIGAEGDRQRSGLGAAMALAQTANDIPRLFALVAASAVLGVLIKHCARQSGEEGAVVARVAATHARLTGRLSGHWQPAGRHRRRALVAGAAVRGLVVREPGQRLAVLRRLGHHPRRVPGRLAGRGGGRNVLSSLRNLAEGFLLAAFLGVLVGTVLGLVRPLGDAVSPIVEFLRSVPGVALLPIGLLIFASAPR